MILEQSTAQGDDQRKEIHCSSGQQRIQANLASQAIAALKWERWEYDPRSAFSKAFQVIYGRKFSRADPD
jgi:hypothetical protein